MKTFLFLIFNHLGFHFITPTTILRKPDTLGKTVQMWFDIVFVVLCFCGCDSTFVRMSFLMKSMIPPTFPSRSRRNGVLKPFKKNWRSGDELSNLSSDILKISILTIIVSATESNLFRIELIFRQAKISLLKLPLRKVCKLKSTSEFAFSRVSDRQSFTQ